MIKKEMNSKEKIISGIAVFFIIIVVVVPGFVAGISLIPILGFAPGKVDAWIGFWGSYLGGIVGLIAVVVTTWFIIEKQKQLERERFLIQFNIEKYEKALGILNRFEQELTKHTESYNQIVGFVLKYFNYVLTDAIIPSEEFEKYESKVEEHAKNITEMLNELRNLEKVIKPFEFNNLDDATWLYLGGIRSSLSLLNTTQRELVIREHNSYNSYLGQSNGYITESRNIIYDYIKEELENYNSHKK